MMKLRFQELNNLLKVTQLIRVRRNIQIQVV